MFFHNQTSHSSAVSWSLTVVLLALCCNTTQATPPFVSEPWVDLTHPFAESTIFWPTEMGFQLIRGANGKTKNGYYYAANRFRMAEHGGTHLDAPRHFSKAGQTADAIPLGKLIGEAAVIDVSAACATDSDYQVTVDDLMAWEKVHHQQLVERIVLLRTGWSRHWPDRLAYLGTDTRGPTAVSKLHFPGLSALAAKWLVDHRRPKAVGIDTASIDHGQSSNFAAHVTLCGANVPIFENVAELQQLPSVGTFIVALPMKIAGGSGAPLRIVAKLPVERPLKEIR